MTSDKDKKNLKKGEVTLKGKVVSTKMKDTVVVSVGRFVKHQKYGKYMTFSKRYKAHDPSNSLKDGDKVTIVECKPISKDKHFRIVASDKVES